MFLLSLRCRHCHSVVLLNVLTLFFLFLFFYQYFIVNDCFFMLLPLLLDNAIVLCPIWIDRIGSDRIGRIGFLEDSDVVLVADRKSRSGLDLGLGTRNSSGHVPGRVCVCGGGNRYFVTAPSPPLPSISCFWTPSSVDF